MVQDLTYTTVNRVLNSWEIIRRIPNFDEVVGIKLFKIFFILDPSAQVIFGGGKKRRPKQQSDEKKDGGSCISDDDEFVNNPRMVQHAKVFVRMFDRAVDMLGPESELITEILMDLGKDHAKFGVKPTHYPSMGQALMTVLEQILGADEFNAETRNSWVEVYQAMSYDMIRAQRM
jgi:hypothetical protein